MSITNFDTPGSVFTLNVPAPWYTVQIESWGAGGGNGTLWDDLGNNYNGTGGHGGYSKTSFLTSYAGDLKIVVGGVNEGGNGNSGGGLDRKGGNGGGGSYVYFQNLSGKFDLKSVAGGGGGGGGIETNDPLTSNPDGGDSESNGGDASVSGANAGGGIKGISNTNGAGGVGNEGTGNSGSGTMTLIDVTTVTTGLTSQGGNCFSNPGYGAGGGGNGYGAGGAGGITFDTFLGLFGGAGGGGGNFGTTTVSDGTLNAPISGISSPANSGYVRVTLTYTPCFGEETKILCLEDNKEVYTLITKLKTGSIVKTYRQGYKKIETIGRSKVFNSSVERIPQRLYILKKEFYPELTEDLILTGYHSILVDNLTHEERKKTIEYMRNIYITEDKYRLIACVDQRALPFEKMGLYNVYHIALENEDYYSNYGVYANGLLVETCSKRYIKELSGMELL